MAAIALPRLVRIGAGAFKETPALLAQLGLSHPLIVTDPYLAQSGGLERLVQILADAGIQARSYAEVVPDPTVASVNGAVDMIRGASFDCIIGFGGGSPIDTAKAAAVLSQRGGSMQALKAPHQEDRPGLPIIAIPTTAGTGSEATRFTIITDETQGEKMLCAGLAYLPMAAVVDFELTLSKPQRLTADTGIDALTHAIEAYVSRRANPFSDGMALAAMRAIWPAIRTAYGEPGNPDARAAMMLGAHQAGIAFSNASVALVHGMSRPIGAHFHVAHGLSNAMLLPTITRWSASGALPRYATCARTMGIVPEGTDDDTAVARLAQALATLNRDLAVPTPKSYGIAPDQWTRLIPLMAEQALASGSPANNPRIPDAAMIEALYREVWD
jgi:alcohol dehydrogenase class IV